MNYIIGQVGIFHSRGKSWRGGELRETWRDKVGEEESVSKTRMLQTGIIRTNCVDCLDRCAG